MVLFNVTRAIFVIFFYLNDPPAVIESTGNYRDVTWASLQLDTVQFDHLYGVTLDDASARVRPRTWRCCREPSLSIYVRAVINIPRPHAWLLPAFSTLMHFSGEKE